MKSLLITPLAVLALLAPLYSGADFDRGMATYKVEGYATASQKFKKVTEQVDVGGGCASM